MKTIITIRTGKGKKMSKKEYNRAMSEMKHITLKTLWAFRGKTEITLAPFKDGIRLVAK